MNIADFKCGDVVTLTRKGFNQGQEWNWAGVYQLHLGINYIVESSHGNAVHLVNKKDEQECYYTYNSSAFRLADNFAADNLYSFEIGDKIRLTPQGFVVAVELKWWGSTPLEPGRVYTIVYASHNDVIIDPGVQDGVNQGYYHDSVFEKVDSMSEDKSEIAKLLALKEQSDAKIVELESVVNLQNTKITHLEMIVNAREARIKDLWEDFEKISAGIRKANKDIKTLISESKRPLGYTLGVKVLDSTLKGK